MVSLPFVMSFSGLDKFRVPKDLFATLFIALIAGAYLLLRPQTWRIRLRSWEFLLGLSLLYVVLHSLLFSPLTSRLSGVISVLFFGAFLLVLIPILSLQAQKSIWLWIAGAVSIDAVVTVFQYFGAFPLMIYAETGREIHGRMTTAGYIGEANSGGFLFGLCALMMIHAVATEKRRLVRFLALVFLLANLAGLAFTWTLTAIVALTACFALWLAFHHWWWFHNGGKVTRNLVVFWVLVLVGVAGAGGLLIKSGAAGRAQTAWRQMAAGDWTVATAGRQPVYAITWHMIRERPWLGRGLDTFGHDFFFYRTEDPYAQRLNLVDQPGSFQEVHNDYLQIWEELGLPGLLIFLVLAKILLFQGIRFVRRSRDPDESYWAAMLVLGLVFVGISSLTFFPFRLSITAAYIVLLAAGLRRLTRPLAPSPSPAWSSRVLRLWNQPQWKVTVVAVLVLWTGYSQVQKWIANVEAGTASYLLENAVSDQYGERYRQVFADTAMDKLETAGRLYPGLSEIYNLQGSAAMILGRYSQAIRYYEKATRLIPSPEVLTNLASAYLSDDDLDKARSSLQTALRYNPNYGKAKEALQFLETKGR